MPTTSKNLRYPSPGAAPNVAQDIQNLAADVNTALPGNWVYQIRSNSYTTSPSAGASMATLATATFSVVVPTGRTLEVEFKAPRLTLGASADTRLQLVIGGVVEDYQMFSTGPSMSIYTPVRLTGALVGTGASVTVAAQCAVPGIVGSTIDGASGAGPVILRYRIV